MWEVKIRSTWKHGCIDGTICIQPDLHGLCHTHIHTQWWETSNKQFNLNVCVCAVMWLQTLHHNPEMSQSWGVAMCRQTRVQPQRTTALRDMNMTLKLSSCCGSLFDNHYYPASGKLLTEKLYPPVTKETIKILTREHYWINAGYAAMALTMSPCSLSRNFFLSGKWNRWIDTRLKFNQTQILMNKWLTAKHRHDIKKNLAATVIF